VDPRAGLGDVEKRKLLTLPELELRPLGHPARSQSLYRLRTLILFIHEKLTSVAIPDRNLALQKLTLALLELSL
jgi:hypothetical protein